MDIPEQLATLPQWIVWRYVGEDRRKVPIDPKNGQNAKTNTPATWGTLAQAQATGESLGFVFAPDDGLFGVDLDGCISPGGEVAEWATAIIDRFATYAEISPSGTGIKLWLRGVMPGGAGRKRQIEVPDIAGKPPQIEAYDRGRYFAFTGQAFGDWSIRDCQAELELRRWPNTGPHPCPPSRPRTRAHRPMVRSRSQSERPATSIVCRRQ